MRAELMFVWFWGEWRGEKPRRHWVTEKLRLVALNQLDEHIRKIQLDSISLTLYWESSLPTPKLESLDMLFQIVLVLFFLSFTTFPVL